MGEGPKGVRKFSTGLQLYQGQINGLLQAYFKDYFKGGCCLEHDSILENIALW